MIDTAWNPHLLTFRPREHIGFPYRSPGIRGKVQGRPADFTRILTAAESWFRVGAYLVRVCVCVCVCAATWPPAAAAIDRLWGE